jgi:outer membrane protein
MFARGIFAFLQRWIGVRIITLNYRDVFHCYFPFCLDDYLFTFEKNKNFMKKLVILFILIITFQTLNAQKYGYLNKEEVFKSIPEYDSATVQVEKLRKEYENLLASMQGEYSNKSASLNNESEGISDYLRKTKQDELKNLDVRIQLFSVRANTQLEEKKNQLFQPIITRVDNAIKAVATEQGFIFVIDSGQMLFTDEKKCTNILPLVKAKLGVK